MEKHIHDRFQCAPHHWHCECDPNTLEETWCNPYWVEGHCPDNPEREQDIFD